MNRIYGLFERKRNEIGGWKRVVWEDPQGHPHMTSAFTKNRAVSYFQDTLINGVFNPEFVLELRMVGHEVSASYFETQAHLRTLRNDA